jgi:hypothetical protein
MQTLDSMMAIETVLRGDIARRNERVNHDGWWRHESVKRAPLRAKLAGNLAALADRLSPDGRST